MVAVMGVPVTIIASEGGLDLQYSFAIEYLDRLELSQNHSAGEEGVL